jgi:hypothetical protein
MLSPSWQPVQPRNDTRRATALPRLPLAQTSTIEFCVSNGAIARVCPLTFILGGENKGEGDVSE